MCGKNFLSFPFRTILSARLVNKCMPKHLNANENVSLQANANAIAIFQEHIQMKFKCLGVAFKCKCKLLGVAFKCKCKRFDYTFANTCELISNVLALF